MQTPDLAVAPEYILPNTFNFTYFFDRHKEAPRFGISTTLNVDAILRKIVRSRLVGHF